MSDSGRVIALAIKPEHRAPMSEVNEFAVTTRGIEGNVGQSNPRRVTLLSREQWDEAQAVLNADIPWTARRANILVEDVPLATLLGKRLRVGDVEMLIHGVTEPCGRMDEAHPGLRRALEPDCRGGMHAEVLNDGAIRVGDTISIEAGSKV
jgi:MOSC domain-containing protein YiiM